MADGLTCVSGPPYSRIHRPSLLHLFLFLSWKRGAYFFKVLGDSSKAQAQGGRRGIFQDSQLLSSGLFVLNASEVLSGAKSRKERSGFLHPKAAPPSTPCPGRLTWSSLPRPLHVAVRPPAQWHLTSPACRAPCFLKKTKISLRRQLSLGHLPAGPPPARSSPFFENCLREKRPQELVPGPHSAGGLAHGPFLWHQQ